MLSILSLLLLLTYIGHNDDMTMVSSSHASQGTCLSV